MTAESPTDSANAPAGGAGREPSLGPACLVLSILGLASFSAFCAFGSWVVFANQYPIAVQAIQKQLVPWVETSQLATEDKRSIIEQLDAIVVLLNAQSIDKQQLSRLRNCLQDNPILLWGGIQSIEHQAGAAGLTDTELQSLRRLNQRMMRAVTERKIGRRDLEFTLQELSVVDRQGINLEVRSNLSADQVRSYMKRAENLVSRSQIPNEPFEKSPAEAFAILVEAALDIPPN